MNNIDTSGFVLKTKYDTYKSDLERKISDAEKKVPDTSGLVEKLDYNSKITELESKTPSISGLATNFALTAVENKIPDVSNLVTKKKQIITQKSMKLKIKLVIIFFFHLFFSFSNLHTRKIKPKNTIYEVNTISLLETIPSEN